MESEQLENSIEIMSSELKYLVDKQCREASLRSQTLGYELGDRPSKYFLNFERSRYANRALTKLVDNNGSIIETKMRY